MAHARRFTREKTEEDIGCDQTETFSKLKGFYDGNCT